MINNLCLGKFIQTNKTRVESVQLGKNLDLTIFCPGHLVLEIWSTKSLVNQNC